jgi:putative oxidoreductase
VPTSDLLDNLVSTSVRVAVGAAIIPHGLSLLLGGHESFAENAVSQIGGSLSLLASYLAIYLELIGGICVAVGFFTRAFAGALAAEMFWAANQFFFYGSVSKGADTGSDLWQFPLFVAVLLIFVVIRGSGPWSLDRLLIKKKRSRLG